MPKIIDHDARRRELATVAVQAIDELGLDAVRLVDIARLAGCTTGAVSHYFGSKDEVLEAALGCVLSSLATHLSYAPLADREDFVRQLGAVLPLDDARRRDWRVWIAFCGRAVSSEALAQAHARWYAALQEDLEVTLKALFQLPAAESRALATQCIATLDGVGLRATLESWPPKRQLELLQAQLDAQLPTTPTNARRRA